jgi:hypothetical protein
MPLVHAHRDGAPRGRVLLDLSYDGAASTPDAAAIDARLAEGWEVVSFDARGLGENRIRYRAVSVDDPALAPATEEEAYASPLSGVLANHVYNALLSGRPYFVELMQDADIAARFARERLGASRVAVCGRGPARTWAAAVARAVPGIEAGPGTDASALDWARLVETEQELWPIHQLLPGGAYLR